MLVTLGAYDGAILLEPKGTFFFFFTIQLISKHAGDIADPRPQITVVGSSPLPPT